jgi:hypothetical protein
MLGAAHLGLTKAHLKKGGIRVAQGSHVQIIIVEPIACQVSLLPLLFPPFSFNQSLVVLRSYSFFVRLLH